MDLSVIKHKILAEIIVFVRMLAENCAIKNDSSPQNDTAKIVLIAILRLTKNFLLILDERKSQNYKLAIIKEYLEYLQAAIGTGIVSGVAAIDKDISVILRYINVVQSSPSKVEYLIKNTHDTVHKFVDFDMVNAQLVAFWLQTICTMDDLHKIQVLLLFCTKDEQAKVYAHDSSLLQNKRFQVLLECLKEC